MTPSSRNREVISFKVKSKRLPKAVSERLRHWFNRLFGFERFNALYRELPTRIEQYAFSPEGTTKIVRNVHGDSSGVRGAAWLWPAETGSAP